MIACIIRYEIEPFQSEHFEAYAKGWNDVIPRCGAQPIGYFTPHEGSLTTACGAYFIPSLAAYEEFKRKLAADSAARDNLAFAKRDRFIRREDRIFLKLVEGIERDRPMIAVIFEVEPAGGRSGDYLGIAANLRPLLDHIDGFISIERFESLATPGKYVSLSFWRDEAAVRQWRNTEEHRAAQAAGRAGILRAYRLRVAEVSRDYGMSDRKQAPADSKAIHDGQA